MSSSNNRRLHTATSIARKISGDSNAQAIKFGQTVRGVCWIVYLSNGKKCSQFLRKSITEHDLMDDVLVFLSDPKASDSRAAYLTGTYKVYSLCSRTKYAMESRGSEVYKCTCKSFKYRGECKHALAASVLIDRYIEDAAIAAKESIISQPKRESMKKSKQSVELVKQRLAVMSESLTGTQSEVLAKKISKKENKAKPSAPAKLSQANRPLQSNYPLPSKIVAAHRGAIAKIESKQRKAKSNQSMVSIADVVSAASAEPVGSIAQAAGGHQSSKSIFDDAIEASSIVEYRFDPKSSLWVSDCGPSLLANSLAAHLTNELSFGSQCYVYDSTGVKYECYLIGDSLCKRKV